jgi:enoyl-CoA hydratase/carnithine racemase
MVVETMIEAAAQGRSVIQGQAGTPIIRIVRETPAFWRATFDNPPLNIVGPDGVRELAALMDQLETDPRVKVIVFGSALPDYFIAHYDVLGDIGASTKMPPGPTGMHPVPDFMVRLARSPVVSIAAIRGRATGIGSELALACDMRFASRENAVMSQWEVGAGLVPGGGPMARLPRLIGRGRALEMLLGADDIDGALAERYGYVNRAVPDAELDGFVDALARRIAAFDADALATTKRFVDLCSLPDDSEMPSAWDAFVQSVGRPATQARLAALVELGLQTAGDVERRLGYYTAHLR